MSRRFDIDGLLDIVSQIIDLAFSEDEPKPTQYARTRLRLLLYDVSNQAVDEGWSHFPRGAVTTDDQGGLRVEWNHDCMNIALVVGAKESDKSYVYFGMDPLPGRTYPAEPASLASCLEKLVVTQNILGEL